MQAYALSNRLKKDLKDVEIEIIDYETEASMYRYSTRMFDMIKTQSGINNKIKILLKVIARPSFLEEKRQLNQAFIADYKYLPLSNEKNGNR